MQCDGPAWFRLSRSQVKRSCCSCRVTGFGLRRSEIPRLVSDGHGKSRSSNHTATLFFPSKSNRHKMGNRSIMSKSTRGNGRGNGVKAAWVFYLAGFRGFCPSSHLSNRTLAGPRTLGCLQIRCVLRLRAGCNNCVLRSLSIDHIDILVGTASTT
jgi:hypothetical protein